MFEGWRRKENKTEKAVVKEESSMMWLTFLHRQVDEMWPTKFPDKIWEWSVNGQRILRCWVILVIQVNNILIHSNESYGGPTLAGAKLRTSYTQGAEFILNGRIFNWGAFLQWFTTSAKEDLPETLRWAELLISCPTLIRGLFTESEHTAHGENSASRGGHCPTAWCIEFNAYACHVFVDWLNFMHRI